MPAAEKNAHASTRAATIVATIAKAAACVLPLVPAIKINLEASQAQGVAWTTFAVGSVIAGAVFVELFLEGTSVSKTALFGLLALFFVSSNILTAIGNSANHRDLSRDAALSLATKKTRLEDRRIELSQSRQDQAAIAGNASPESVEADIRASKARDAKLWDSTFNCDPRWATREAARAFCSGLADLEKKKAAAIRRDKIDADLAKLDEKDVDAPPAAIESYVANMSRFIGMFGYSVDDNGKALIESSRDWQKGVGVELLAAFGPTALLSLLGRFLPAQEAQPQPLRKPEKAAKGKTPAIAPCGDAASVIVASSQDEDAEIDAFFARRLETVQNEFIAATALYRAWAADCAEHGIDVGSQKAFNHRIRRRVGYDRNNGRPRYCHIRLKPKEHAHLRLAISNA